MGQPLDDLGETSRGPRDPVAAVDRLLAANAEERAELLELRATLAAAQAVAGNGLDTAAVDDFAEAALIDTHSAAARFGYPVCTLARWAREGDGVKRGGRWLLSTKRLRARLRV